MGYVVSVDPALGILGVLLEPATVVAKAWDHIEKIGRRAAWAPEKVLITGAGPIGLLAALLATQRGYQTYVLDRVTEGRKPEMVRRIGQPISIAGTSARRPPSLTSSSNAPGMCRCCSRQARSTSDTG